MLLNELMKADYATSMYANYAPTNIEDTLKFINEHSFWMPRHVCLKERFTIHTYGLPATEPDGNVVGIRF